jgi:hypothetical protein
VVEATLTVTATNIINITGITTGDHTDATNITINTGKYRNHHGYHKYRHQMISWQPIACVVQWLERWAQ